MKNKLFGTSLTLATLLGVAMGAASCGGPKVDPYSVDLSIDPTGAHITMWHPFGQDVGPELEKVIDDFQKETGIRVTVESREGYDNLKKAVALAASGRKYPNITVGYPDHFVEYVDSDIIVRLDYYLENDKDCIPLKEHVYNIAESDFYSSYMIENKSIEYDEEGNPYILGIPFNKSTEVMTYNKTLMTYLNSLDKDIVVPSTWQQVRTIGQKMIAKMNEIAESGNLVIVQNQQTKEFDRVAEIKDIPSGSKLYLDLSDSTFDVTKFRPISYDSLANFFITELRNWGSEYTAVDKNTRQGYLAFYENNTKQKTKEMMQFFRDLYADGILGVPKTWEESKYSSNPFKNCLVGMMVGSTAGVTNSVAAGNKFSVDAAPVPFNEENNGKKYVISQGTNLCLLDKGSEKQRVASWVLLKYLAKYANGLFCANTGYFPSCEFAQNSEDYQDMLNKPTSRATPAEILLKNTAAVNTNTYMPEANLWEKFVDAPFSGSASIREDVKEIVNNMLFSEASFDTILTNFYTSHASYVRK